MKFSCTQENLSLGLNLVSRVANRNATLPILSNILLRTTKTGLELIATNLEVAVVTTVRGKVESEGVITISGRLISETVALFPHERVDLTLEEQNLTLQCGRHHTVIRGVAADDFPVIPGVIGENNFTIPASKIRQALNSVSFAVNPEEGRPEIGGVYIKASPNSLVVVGTDSYRLAEYTINDVVGIKNSHQLIVPLRTINEVARVLEGAGEEEVRVAVNDNQIAWEVGDTKIISRLVAGQYPDYQQIVPQNTVTKITVARDELLRAVRGASLFVRAGINDVRLGFDPNKQLLQISATNSQVGETTTELAPQSISGQVGDIVFNYHYLIDGLQALSTKDVTLELVNSTSPGVLRPTNQTDYLYIIMPIRQ